MKWLQNISTQKSTGAKTNQRATHAVFAQNLGYKPQKCTITERISYSRYTPKQVERLQGTPSFEVFVSCCSAHRSSVLALRYSVTTPRSSVVQSFNQSVLYSPVDSYSVHIHLLRHSLQSSQIYTDEVTWIAATPTPLWLLRNTKPRLHNVQLTLAIQVAPVPHCTCWNVSLVPTNTISIWWVRSKKTDWKFEITKIGNHPNSWFLTILKTQLVIRHGHY